MRDIQRGRDIGRGISRLPAGGLHPRMLGSHPEPKADAQTLSHPGIPKMVILKKELMYIHHSSLYEH